MKYYESIVPGVDDFVASERKTLFLKKLGANRRKILAKSEASFNLICYSRTQRSVVCSDLSGLVRCLDVESASINWSVKIPDGVYSLCIWESAEAVFIGGDRARWFSLKSGMLLSAAPWNTFPRINIAKSAGEGIGIQQGPLFAYVATPESEWVPLPVPMMRFINAIGADQLALDVCESEIYNRILVFNRTTGTQSNLIILTGVDFINRMRTLPDRNLAILTDMEQGGMGLWHSDGKTAELKQVFVERNLSQISEDGRHVISMAGEWLPVNLS